MKKIAEKCAEKIADQLMRPISKINEEDYPDKKAFKEAMRLFSSLHVSKLVGLVPPCTINGKRVYNPTFDQLYEDQNRRNVERKAEYERIMSKEYNPSEDEVKQVEIATAIETEEGRASLIEIMLKVQGEEESSD